MTETDLAKEKWHEICYLLSDSINPNISENIYEQKVIMALETLGWSQFRKEIQTQISLPIGRQSTIRPDIMIHDPDGKALVAIEVKRPSERIIDFDQLKSYMRQTRAVFGMLVGREIRIYYDGPLNKYSEPLQLEKISFEPASPAGERFVETFTKANFLNEQYHPYLNERISQFSQKREITKLKRDVCSEHTKGKVLEFLKAEYAERGQDIISEALKDLNIKIYYEDSTTPTKIKRSPIKRIQPDKKATKGSKVPSPSALEWSSNIPELSNFHFRNWKGICDHLNLDVRGNSARRVLKKWVEQEKPRWPEVPDP
ncbi:type I restriction enzyme HsdR N-terminal domain-containing protein [Thermodesulfobacteriota bacterium]